MAKSPAKQSYRYTGPVTPLDLGGSEPKMLFPGTSYRDLPEDNPTVKNLIARKLLIAETQAVAEPASSEGA
ncbi:hypothetical protein I6F11_17425 [Ensifer sp. NBAIM29]|nr:hypothetical protein [Ensifer sp. NBAIM29]